MRQNHPLDEALVALHLGRTEAPAVRAAREHLAAGCERCRERFAALAKVAAAFAAPRLTDVPEAILARASAWLDKQETAQKAHPATAAGGQRAKSLRRKAAQVLQEIRAALVLDTAGGMLLQGVRGRAGGAARQMMYESSAGDLHVQLSEPAAHRITLHGQFLPTEAAPSVSSGRAVLAGEDKRQTLRLSSVGEFEFKNLAPGSAQLEIEWGGRRIVAGPIDLGMDD